MRSVNIDRRLFLKKGAGSITGFMLLNAVPPWIKASLPHSTVYRERSFYTMGSVLTLSVYGEEAKDTDQGIKRVAEEFARVDALLSLFKPESFVCMLNRAAGRDPLPADPDVIELLLSAKRFSMLTGGAFDITVEPLMRAWGFRDEKRELSRIPSDRELRELLSAVGHENLVVQRDDGLVGLRHPRAAIDLGGIAVGWTLDRAVEILREYGITAAFVNHAGDAFALGVPEESNAWMVGIPDPSRPKEIIHEMKVRDEAVSTSGNYQNFVQRGEERFGHLLHPQSGKPGSEVLSMTVVAETALAADALSTGLFCLGPDKSSAIPPQPVKTIRIEEKENGLIVRESGPET